ncbi:HtpX-like protease [Micromonospora rosaria]|uniref:HtpX-like protease n=1 Tax=Micromonospora rosaria TaxID=47874 RepID=A0A136PYM2_9ACTN|nr:M48 family metallopeptidase [Micromonospora rosaria]KXK63296.1 HtpX-like protease [Micromonospora rosaria]
MAATYRALASVLMLAGFYVVALLQLAVVAAGFVWLTRERSGLFATNVMWPLIVALGAVVVGLWRSLRTKAEPPPGLVLTDREAPALWATVRELSAAVATRAPDEIRLVPDVNAAVTEQTRLLGLLGGRRTLLVGLPLLHAMRVDQLRSVLAHELGHFSGRHTRLGGVAYRGRLAIGTTIGRIGRWNPIGMVFRGYARLYLLVDNAASRRQELEADRASVFLAGPEAATSALRGIPAVGAAWSFYEARYVESGWAAGLAPDDLFGGFGELVAARRAEIIRLQEAAPEETGSRWDTHPPIGVRIAAMRSAPAGTGVTDDRPATVLLADVGQAGRALQATVVDHGDRTVLPWPEFIAAALAASTQERADRFYRAAGRFTGDPEPGLGTVLDLVRHNRLGEFAEQFFAQATRREAAQHFADPMELLLVNAAVRSSRAHWQLSWSSPARLVGPAGEPVDLADIAKLAVSPQTLDDALARLAELGVDPGAATVVQQRATGRNAGLLGGMANVKVDGQKRDLLVLDRGLVLIADPGPVGEGEERLRTLVGSTSLEDLAARHTFVPFEEVVSVEVGREVPLKATLTLHGGRTLVLHESFTGDLLEAQSRDTLLEVFASING